MSIIQPCTGAIFKKNYSSTTKVFLFFRFPLCIMKIKAARKIIFMQMKKKNH
jgi:hypothetical protein